MKNIRCLIVEDEPIAQQIIENFVARLPFLELVGKASNVFEAYDMLSQNAIDLIFCDIEMPQISGLEFLKSLPNRPQVIMTTAFHQYAHEGFELDVTDYLLKPIAFERFLRAIQKVKEKIEAKENRSAGCAGSREAGSRLQREDEAGSRLQREPTEDSLRLQREPTDYIFVKEDGNLVKIQFVDIQYVEAMKDYVKIYLENRFIVTYLTMKKMEEALPEVVFGRIHKSYIANLTHITGISGNMLALRSKVQIPIGMLYRDGLLAKLGEQIVVR
jgi:two-component system, LytTR family, response regulator